MLIFTDGFDHYNTSQLNRKWNTVVGGPTIAANGRYGGNSYDIVNPQDKYITKVLPNINEVIIGFAFRYSAVAGGAKFLSLSDAGFNHLDLRLTSGGIIQIYRETSALINSSSVGIALNTWAYLEFKVLIHGSTGSYTLRLNGVNVASATNVNTKHSSGGAYVNVVLLGTFSTANPTGTWNYDDLYIADTTGTVNNDFLGDIKVIALYPNAEGDTLQWTPSTSTIHNVLVDETVPNDDTDYVSTATANNIDLFNLGALGTSAPIKGTQVNLCARKDDAGTRLVAPILRHGGVDYQGTNLTVLDSYSYLTKAYDLNPATSGVFTESEINALQAGIKLVS